MIRKQTVWILVVLGALFAAACSSGGDGGDGGDGGSGGGAELVALSRDGFSSDVSYVEQVAARTAELESYEFVMEFGMDGIPDLGSMTFKGEGAFDAKHNRMRMAFDLSSLLDAAPAGTSDAELAMMRGLLGDGLIELIVDGDTMYMSWSLFSLLLGAETKWVSFEGEAGSDALDFGGGVNVGQMGMGPDSFFDFFDGISSIEEDGRFIIRGVETTRFVGSIDLEDAIAAAADPSQRAALEAQVASLGVDAFGAMPVSVWVDDMGYVRKFELSFDFGALGGGSNGPAEMYVSLELFNFGDAVSIELPSSDEVTVIDENSLFGGLGGFGEGEGF